MRSRVSVCYSGQNDILMIASSVLAIHCLLKGKRRAFYAWSVLAIAIKPFFLLPFMAVVMLSEKNFIKLAGKALLVSSGLIVQKLFFYGAPGYAESMTSGPAKQMLRDMFPVNLTTSFGGISFFAIALVLIYFYCYTRRLDDSDGAALLPKYTVYMITVTYTAYLMFSPFSFYRLATLTPFLYIVLVQNDEMRLYNAIFDTAMQFAMMMRLVLRGSKMFQVRFINKSQDRAAGKDPADVCGRGGDRRDHAAGAQPPRKAGEAQGQRRQACAHPDLGARGADYPVHAAEPVPVRQDCHKGIFIRIERGCHHVVTASF